MGDRPEYTQIFEYLRDNYEFKAPDSPRTRFFKRDIAFNQYANLDGPVSENIQKFESEKEAADVVEEFARNAGADLVGFTLVKDNFVFEGTDMPHKYAVVIAKEMDHDLINTAPEPPSGTEVLRAYWRLGDVAVKLAAFIRSMGYSARAHHPRSFVNQDPTVLQPIAAIEAGLGECGKMGLLITEEFGPRIRVSTVTTDLALPQDPPKVFGVQKFCENCTRCQDACDGDAITGETRPYKEGMEQYVIDPYKCLPYFAEYDGCNLCVSKCAFNLKGEELKAFVAKLNK